MRYASKNLMMSSPMMPAQPALDPALDDDQNAELTAEERSRRGTIIVIVVIVAIGGIALIWWMYSQKSKAKR